MGLLPMGLPVEQPSLSGTLTESKYASTFAPGMSACTLSTSSALKWVGEVMKRRLCR